MSWSCSVLVGLALFLSWPSAAAADEHPLAYVRGPHTLVTRYQDPSVRLRGDYEANNLLLLVWQPEWEETVKQVAVAAAHEIPVKVLIPKGVWRESRAFRRWAKRQCVEILFHRYDTAWIRDYGPVQVMEGEHVTWRDFAYDAERPKDDVFPVAIASTYRVPLELAVGRLDGGGLVSNGQGLCVMTDASVSELDIPDAEGEGMERFLGNLGCRALATIDALPQEQTGHADVSVQFLEYDLVAVAAMDPKMDPVQSRLLDTAARRITRAAKRLGVDLRVVRVPMTHQGEVFYSYVNAVRAGNTLLVPSYRDVTQPVQAAAYAAFTNALPGLRIVPIVADEVVEYGGALHCITLGLQVPQEPAKKSACGEVKLVRKRAVARRAHRKRTRRL